MIRTEEGVRTFRWVFYIGSIQLLAFFVVPALLFPARLLLPIEVFLALTLGLIPGLFLWVVNLAGILLDRDRRPLYYAAAAVLGLWFVWAAISWAEIEHMDYLLH